MTDSNCPDIVWVVIEGGKKGLIVAQSADSLINSFFALGIKNIQDECNRVSHAYQNIWSSRSPTDTMSEYGLSLTYADGCAELKPHFDLFLPHTLRTKILDSSFRNNPDTPATIQYSMRDFKNPLLTIYLTSIEVLGSRVIWKWLSFDCVIYHELLHACGDSPILRKEIHDGVLRHTMVPMEAIANLRSHN